MSIVLLYFYFIYLFFFFAFVKLSKNLNNGLSKIKLLFSPICSVVGMQEVCRLVAGGWYEGSVGSCYGVEHSSGEIKIATIYCRAAIYQGWRFCRNYATLK